MAKAVLFDFSGTLFHCESAESWLRAALDRAGITASDAEVEVWAERLHASGGQAGAYSEFAVPAHLTDLWARRDRRGPPGRLHRAGGDGRAAVARPRGHLV